MATTRITDSAKSLEAILSEYESNTYSHFVLKYSDKNFFADQTSEEVNPKQRVLWSLSAVTDKGLVLPFTGVPFIFLGNRTLACHHGPDLNRSTKTRQRELRAQRTLQSPGPKQRFLVQPTKKMDCPVVIHMKKIISFPEFKIEADSEYARRVTGKQLKEALASYAAKRLAGEKAKELVKKLEYYVLLPDPMTHENHVLQETQGIVEPSRGRKKKMLVDSTEMESLTEAQPESVLVENSSVATCSIAERLQSKSTNVEISQNNFEAFLRTLTADLAPFTAHEVNETDPRYYQNPGDVAALLTKAKLSIRYSKLDQEAVTVLAVELQQLGHEIYFMPTAVIQEADIQLGNVSHRDWDEDDDIECKQEVPNADFMFVYQSPDMKRLYRRYGNQLIVVDAVYRSGRYPVPVFFLLVRTNVSYQVVAVFAMQQETTLTVAGALFIIKSWNPDVCPRYAMVDSSNEEITALEQTFPGVFVYLCDYHRDCSWNAWIAKPENGLSLDADYVKARLKKIANAVNPDDVSSALVEFETSTQFTSNKHLSNWFYNKWKPLLTKWSLAYRADSEFMLALLTNNGSKRINDDFKYDFLEACQQMSLSEFLRVVVHQFLPNQFRTYVDLNVRSSSLYRRYNEDVPVFLRNRPRRLIDYMRRKMMSVDATSIAGITIKSPDGVFLVPASGLGGDRQHFKVSFGSESSCCSCSCVSFQRTRLLCRHFFAVMQAMPGWTFEKISPIYANNPLLLLDEEVLAREVRLGRPANDNDDDAGRTTSPIHSTGCVDDPLAESEGSTRRVSRKTGRRLAKSDKSKLLLRSEQLSARRVLKRLFDWTCSTTDAVALNEMRRKLDAISEALPKGADVIVSSSNALMLSSTAIGKRKRCVLSNAVGRPNKEKYNECQLEISVIDDSKNGSGNVSTTYVTLVTANDT